MAMVPDLPQTVGDFSRLLQPFSAGLTSLDTVSILDFLDFPFLSTQFSACLASILPVGPAPFLVDKRGRAEVLL